MTCQYWRIAETEGGLAYQTFANLGLPEPSAFTYADHQDSRVKSDGQLALLGRSKVTVLFDTLNSEQGWKIRNVIDTVLNNGGFIFMTIPRSDGSNPGWDWIDVTGVPHRPVVSGDGSYTGRKGDVFYTNYQINLETVSIVNEPSIYII